MCRPLVYEDGRPVGEKKLKPRLTNGFFLFQALQKLGVFLINMCKFLAIFKLRYEGQNEKL